VNRPGFGGGPNFLRGWGYDEENLEPLFA
jgi:hypothetical protein